MLIKFVSAVMRSAAIQKVVQDICRNFPLCAEYEEPKRSHVRLLLEATQQGKVSVAADILEDFPACIMEEIPETGDTALHLATRSGNATMVKVLLGHVRGEFYYDSLLDKLDDDGNTVMHLAVATKQSQIIEMLLENESAERRMLIVNAMNRDGFTALDILDMVFENRELDIKIEETLRKSGGLRAGEKEKLHEYEIELTELEFIQLNRSALLVNTYFRSLIFASLIATVTFQIAFNPVLHRVPVWLNSVGFFTSVAFITVIIYGQIPMKLWLHISVLSASGAYMCGILAVLPQQVAAVMFIGSVALCVALFGGLLLHQKMLHDIHSARKAGFTPFTDSGA